MGKRSSIMYRSFINTTYPVKLGEDVGVGGYCKIFTHGSWQSVLEGYPVQFGPVTIEDNVWLPWDVFILPGVRIGKGSTIGARSLVRADVPRNSLALGIPAKVVRQPYPERPTKEERVQKMNGILADLKEHFEWIGTQVSVSQVGETSWTVRHGQDSVALVLERVEGFSPKQLVDLGRYVDTLNLDVAWQRELRSFLGRYGIRTEHAI
jgi:hypothetical protein